MRHARHDGLEDVVCRGFTHSNPFFDEEVVRFVVQQKMKILTSIISKYNNSLMIMF